MVLVNGDLNETINQDKIINISGANTVVVSGNSKETYLKNKTILIDSLIETISTTRNLTISEIIKKL